jgi:large conductance mechanosensitive channel
MVKANGAHEFFRDFQVFIMRGNVIDLAVAVILGVAFGQIVKSLVEDIITPIILQPVLAAAHLNELSQLSINGIKYGIFLAAILNFLVVSFSIFLMVRSLEKVQRRMSRAEAMKELSEPVPDPAVIAQERLTTAIEHLAVSMEDRQN